MPPISTLIQTIVSLRQLQLQEAAQELQRQQMGLSRQQAGVVAQGGFQNLLQGMQDPSQLMGFIPEFTEQTNLSPDALRTMIEQTPPAETTTRAGAVQRGARRTGGILDVPAATRSVAGTTSAGLGEDKFMSTIFGDAQQYLESLPEERRQPLTAGFLTKLMTGQDQGSAARSAATADFLQHAPPALRSRVVAMGLELAPTAPQEMQTELGWAQFRAQQRASEIGLALEEMRIRSSAEQAKQQLGAQAFKELNDLIMNRSELLTNFVRNSGTMTPEGQASFVDQVNAINAQIRSMAPHVYDKGGTTPLTDMPKGSTAGTTGPFSSFLPWLIGKGKP